MKGKHRKHFMTLVCLITGLVILTTAVYANYDNAIGYANYKNAVKKLMVQDNFTADATVDLHVDGESMVKQSMSVKLEGPKKGSSVETSDSYKNYRYYSDGKMVNYWEDSNTYSTYETSSNVMQMLDADDETQQKAVRFAELLADTLVGDLKNSFVLVSDEDGIKEYNVSISGSQIPEVVNAGVSLMFSSIKVNYMERSGWVDYENYEVLIKDVYKKETGKELNWNTDDEEELNEMNEVVGKMGENYYQILQKKGEKGVLFVNVDGTYTYYDSPQEFAKSDDSRNDVNEGSLSEYDMIALFGSDPYIESAKCNFKIDKNGNLISNDMEAVLAGIGDDGQKHTAAMIINATLSDFGTTVADTFDPTGKTKA